MFNIMQGLISEMDNMQVSNATATTSAEKTKFEKSQIDEIKKAIDYVSKLPTTDEWILISPKGKLWIGDVAKMTGVLLHHHPVFSPQINPVFKPQTKVKL